MRFFLKDKISRWEPGRSAEAVKNVALSEDFFDDHLKDDFARTKVRRYVTEEKGHGREEIRSYVICPVPDDLPDRSRWAKLRAIGIAISNTQRDGKDCAEIRYYILSKYLSGRRFAGAVRDHWSIENRLHWLHRCGFRFCL